MRKYFTHDDPVVPLHHPRVLVETAEAQGAERHALLDGTNITEAMLASPDARISYVQFGALVRNALALTGNSGLGIDVGKRLHLPALGMVGLAIMSTSSMGEALDAGLRHYKRIAPTFDLSIEVEGASARFVVRESVPTAPYQAFATETLLVAYALQARALLGKPLPVRRVQLAYPRPSHAERYKEIYDVPYTFDAATTWVELDAAFLAERLAYGDPASAKLAEQYFAEHPLPAHESDGLVLQVRRRILAARGKVPEVAQIARELQTSERSLRRGLSELGTSYQELLDEARRERALEWTRSTSTPFDQLASQLGFSDVRSFRRAFKRWTGRTPSELRDEAAASDATTARVRIGRM
jgi:AraC-like DNA-binding protein